MCVCVLVNRDKDGKREGGGISFMERGIPAMEEIAFLFEGGLK